MNTQLLETVHGRSNHLVDPTLSIWGWQIVLYLFLGGLVAGILVLAAGLQLKEGRRPLSAVLRWAPLSALGLLSLGMFFLWLDLEHPFFAFRFYMLFHLTSPMSWGAWILLLVYPAGILLALTSLTEGERGLVSGRLPASLRGGFSSLAAWADASRRPILLTAAFSGVALGLYTGLLLGTMPARLAWNSALLGPLFLASGTSTGAAFLLLFALDAGERKTLMTWDAAAIGTELALIALMVLGFATGPEPARFAAGLLLGGKYTAVFWSVVVVAGLLVPLGLEAIEARRHLPFTLLIPLLVLAGGLALRWILLAAGQESAFRLLS